MAWIACGNMSVPGPAGADFGVGVTDELGPNTEDNPELWEEFEWTNVQNLGVHFDNNQGGNNLSG